MTQDSAVSSTATGNAPKANLNPSSAKNSQTRSAKEKINSAQVNKMNAVASRMDESGAVASSTAQSSGNKRSKSTNSNLGSGRSEESLSQVGITKVKKAVD